MALKQKHGPRGRIDRAPWWSEDPVHEAFRSTGTARMANISALIRVAHCGTHGAQAPDIMRKLVFTSLVALAGITLGLACTRGDPLGTAGADIVTDDDLARSALTILGAPQLPRPSGEAPSCAFTGCHSINPIGLRQWQTQYKNAMDNLTSDRSKADKINYFRQNPQDPRTGFTPERVGILTAGAHLALGANVNPTRHPETYKQGKLLADLFAGQDALYAEFRKEMLMPVLTDYPRLTASEYETVLTWFQKGLPRVDEIIREERPTVCVDKFDDLRARTIAVKNQTWAAKNKSNRLAMLGCAAPNPDAPASATTCFGQQRDGKDIFPKAADSTFARGWAADGSTIRVLRQFSNPNSFWVRSSADGRFVATGGGRGGGAQAMDLLATLEGKPARDIALQASYDPDFWPDNKAFMFQGGTKFCAQSVLAKPTTTSVSFTEPECSSLSAASGLYQTVGQVVGDNSIGDRFILYSIWAGDSGQYTSQARDTKPRAGADSGIKIFTAIAQGNDVEEGYQVSGNGFDINTPYRGDTMMGRSGKILGSRWAYEAPEGPVVPGVAGAECAPSCIWSAQCANVTPGASLVCTARGESCSTGNLCQPRGPVGPVASGYAIEKLDYQVIDGKYRFTTSSLGNVCLKGNKANFSFDERFLATHHYNEPSDYVAGDDPAYAQKGSSDVFVVDFITGKKQKVTKMGPGQFALYAHFRSDGWLMFLVVDQATNTYHVAASDWAIRQTETAPTP